MDKRITKMFVVASRDETTPSIIFIYRHIVSLSIVSFNKKTESYYIY